MLKQLCFLTTLATACIAQSPLTTIFASNNGGAAGWTMYFDVTVNVPLTFTQFDVNTGATTAGSIDVYFTTSATTYVGNDTNAGAWTLGGSGTCTGLGLNLPTPCVISPFTLAPGNYGMAIVHNGIYPSYTNGTGTATPGSGTNQTYSTSELTVRTGASAGGGLGTAICCTPRVINMNVYYSVSGGGGTVATRASYGTGCYQRYGSFYENFATSAAFDLANSGLSMVPTGTGGYTVLPLLSTYVAPTGAATVLTLGDDTETAVTLSSPFPHSAGTTSSLTVCSNGFVSIATGNGTGYTPTPTTTLAAAQTGWWAQHDYNPTATGSGQVKYEEVGSISYVTWDGVYDYAGTSSANANTFQFQFDRASGLVHIVFGTMSALGNGRMVAYSPGGASVDPGNTDLSTVLAAGGFSTYSNDVAPLRLAASARPLIGTSISLDTSNVTGTGVGINFLSTAGYPAPGIDLGIIGAAGCPALVDIGAGIGNAINNIVPGALSVPFGIPNNTAFLGVGLFSQSAWLDPTANAFGVLTSNGIALVIGNV